MRRFRMSVTPSLVISTIALLVSLSGTAVAAVIVSSNRQVASNTIAGHARITGVHANLITGSIVSSDLSSGYRSALKVHCPAGLLPVGDLCVERALRGRATYSSALATCASVGRRLPDDAAMALAFTGLGAPQSQEWISGRFFEPDVDGAGTMSDNSDRSLVFGWASLSFPLNFRCVVAPHN